MEDKVSTHPNLLSHHMLTAGVMSPAFSSVPRYIMHKPGYFLFTLNMGVPQVPQKCFSPPPNWKALIFSLPLAISSEAKGTTAKVENAAPLCERQKLQWQLTTLFISESSL
jgi:hypothetical protein